MMRNFKAGLALSLVLLIFCSDVFALSGDDHAGLWNDVFGVQDRAAREKIQPLWKAAQEVIDDYKKDYDKLKEKFPWFKFNRTDTHRLLFHWGFNADPKRHSPLVRQVRLRLKDHPDSKNQEREFFSYLATNIQAGRNRDLIKAVTSVTGIPTARGYANAVATIIYDVHLLGDYMTVNTSALPKIDEIENDIVQNGLSKLIAGGDKSERLKKIDDELKASIRAGRGRINSVRAMLLTETVKKYLPQILNERFKKTLSEKGITITEH